MHIINVKVTKFNFSFAVTFRQSDDKYPIKELAKGNRRFTDSTYGDNISLKQLNSVFQPKVSPFHTIIYL